MISSCDRLVSDIVVGASRLDCTAVLGSPILSSAAISGVGGSFAPPRGFEQDGVYLATHASEECGGEEWYRLLLPSLAKSLVLVRLIGLFGEAERRRLHGLLLKWR